MTLEPISATKPNISVNAAPPPSAKKRGIMNLNVSTLFFELALIFMPGFIWIKSTRATGRKVNRLNST
jgi:hypothetical protein